VEETMTKLLATVLLLMAGVTAQASIDSKSRSTQDAPAVDVASSFAEQFMAIKLDLADGETYSEISAEDKDAVMAALQRIAEKLESSGGIGNLTAAERAAVFNDQELANNLLTRAGEDSLLVCKREKKVGSHRTTTHCATVAERRRAADTTEKTLRDNTVRFMCGTNGCRTGN
jgi:hypothetical protein